MLHSVRTRCNICVRNPKHHSCVSQHSYLCEISYSLPSPASMPAIRRSPFLSGSHHLANKRPSWHRTRHSPTQYLDCLVRSRLLWLLRPAANTLTRVYHTSRSWFHCSHINSLCFVVLCSARGVRPVPEWARPNIVTRSTADWSLKLQALGKFLRHLHREPM